MTPQDSAAALRESFGGSVLEVDTFRGEVSAVVVADSIVEIARYCRDDLTYTFLSDITATDWLERNPRFDVNYQLTSLEHWIRFRLKVRVNLGTAIPTVIPVWGAANWAEREIWDMFGIEFEGHPDLRRLLMPEGWIGHPLRKDYPQTQISLPRPKADKIVES